ncbi:MAG: DUF4080 domain-containing protein [Spirochaetes bacterium]|nr:DUF4080 domain-containing protein [Spirochaetota bacterium]
MNKILLIGINARYSHPAMALYYLREYVRDIPWEVVIREFTIHTPVRDILLCIENERPDAVAFSVYIWNNTLVHEVFSTLEQMSDRPVTILGGPDAGYNYTDWFTRFSFIDYVVTGHGENAFRDLLAGGLNHAACLDFEKRVLRKDNPLFSQIPFPYIDEDIQSFAHRKIYYETSRGCPFKCAYCLSSREDQHLDFREINQIKNELAFMMQHRPKIIKLVDRTFNAKKSHAHAVWEYIINTYPGTGTRFHFEVHPALLDENDFKLLETCPNGLFQFEIGIQSTCEPALRAVNRKGDWEAIMPRIKRLIGMNTIPIHVDLIAGLPFEDYDKLAFSFNEVYSLRANHFQLGYLKVLPGTEVMDRAEEWGLNYTPNPPYEVTGNRWLDPGKIKKIKAISKLVDKIYNSHRFIRTLESLRPLYSSPFNLFEAISDGSARKSAAYTEMRWEYLADIIIECALNRHMDKHYILDCLRWDWCESSAANRIPKMLKTDAARQKRKDLLARFRKGWTVPAFEELNEATVTTANIFFPESAEFRDKYLAGKNCAVFLHGKKKPLFLD